MKTTVVKEAGSRRLTIVTYPDPALAKRSEPVEAVTGDIRGLAEGMIDTMIAAPGVGLAAPQVGILKRIVVVDPSVDRDEPVDPPFALVNPEIIDTAGEIVDEEGCLSFPGLYFDLPRPERVTVAYTTLDGRRAEYEAHGTVARCLAHEIEHLDGVLFWDHLDAPQRVWQKMKYYFHRVVG